jgi:hypothetical protein
MRRIHLGADVGGAGALDQASQGRRVEHQVLRVHLDGDLDTVLAGKRIDLGPERHGNIIPLVVERVEIA